MKQPLTKIEIDSYFSANYNILVKELSKQFPKSKQTIDQDLSDCYLYLLRKPVYKIRALIFQYIFYKHHKFYNKKHIHVEISTLQLEATEDEFDPLPELVREAVSKLPLDLQKLYSLYYEQGLSSRTIGKYLNISHTSVCTLVKELQNKVKNYIETTSTKGLGNTP